MLIQSLHFIDLHPVQYNFKQIAVSPDSEFSALQLRQAFGDGKPQAASLCGSGGVSPGEPLA